jgi:hypothetical protein
MRTVVASFSILVAIGAVMACSSGATNKGSGFGSSSSGGSGGSGGSSGSGDDTSSSGSGGSSSGGHLGGSSGSGGSSSGGGCVQDPGSYDIPGDNCDNDGDGKVDNVTTCDSSLSASGDATAFAKAIGLCQQADATHWGVVSATYTYGLTKTGAPPAPPIPGFGGFDNQHGIASKFGDVIKPREGAMLGVLSSGSATETDSDQGPQFKGLKTGMQSPLSQGDIPQNLPKQAGNCPALSDVVNDVIDVKLKIKVPNNAKGLSLDFDFWSGEWPDYVCSNFNDAFVAYLHSAALKDPQKNPNGDPQNISFDANGNTISVNNNFFGVCTPNVQTGCAAGAKKGTSTCAKGPGELAGTGFSDPQQAYCADTSTSGGATSWLTSQAPVQGGETIDLDLLVWDTGDAQYDSSVLIDNFTWVPNPISGPVTVPSPPK